MEVNTTNPGKLVKGYDVIDHPITEITPVLASLSTLFKEINTLKKLPGFNLPSVLSIVGYALNQNKPIVSVLPEESEEES